MWGLKKLAISSLPNRAHSLASWPTAGGSVPKYSTDGVMFCPSRFAITSGRPYALRCATAEFVVPRSIPTKLAMLAGENRGIDRLAGEGMMPPRLRRRDGSTQSTQRVSIGQSAV